MKASKTHLKKVETALRAADSEKAYHWPTIAATLAKEVRRLRDEPRLGCATTKEMIDELAARADVSATIGEEWPSYRTVDF